jgi:hypothetical protein
MTKKRKPAPKEGIETLQSGSKSALPLPDADFSQIAYSELDMSIWEKHKILMEENQLFDDHGPLIVGDRNRGPLINEP